VDIGYIPWTKPALFDSRPCVADDYTELTYGQFNRRIDALAERLSRDLVGYGDTVAIMIPPRVELLVALFAVWRLSAVATLVDPEYDHAETEAQIVDSGANFMITQDARFPDCGLPVLHVDDFPTEPGADPPRGNVVVDDELALVVYADVNEPRGVMLSHRNLVAMSTQITNHLKVSGADHGLLMSPAFHGGSSLISVLTTLLTGAHVTITASTRTEDVLQRVTTVKPTFITGPRHHYENLAALPATSTADTSSLRWAVTGDAPIPADLVATLEQQLGLVMIEAYGHPETCGCSVLNQIDGVRKPGTVGQVVPGQSLKIVDVDGNDLPPGEEGEVIISGPNVMQGYLGKPEETANTLVDGWLHTGDLGRLDDEGYLTLVGDEFELSGRAF